MSDNDLNTLTRQLIQFRDERNWKQFHTLKDLIISLNLEASELLELSQWQSADGFEKSLTDSAKRKNLEDECADVLLYLLLIAEKADIDLIHCASRKIKENAAKYPIEKSRDSAKKYTQL